MADRSQALTLVIDIGKTHAKLLLIDEQGVVQEQHGRNNASVVSPLGYPALDVQGLELWMAQTLRASAHTVYCQRAIVTTHGAALVALADEGLAWEPLDYEWDALADRPDLADAFRAAADPFEQTLSPDLPAGLNAARQLFAVQHLYPQAWQRTRHVLPYAQYWAWKLCGQLATEVTSLGCHTDLWHPVTGDFSGQARAAGWAALFAPVRSAWEVLCTVQPDIATHWGFPPHCQVHVGVHDSNACLARYLPSNATGPHGGGALTLVSSGTWTVLMAPGASSAALVAEDDMLANVDVLGRATPTARFMGGREFAALLEGAQPDAASSDDVQTLVDREIWAMPSWAQQGGPFRGRTGHVQQGAQRWHTGLAQHFSEGQRAALAAMYCAQTTAYLVRRLWAGTAALEADTPPRVVVEGPLVRNALYLGILQALLPEHQCYASDDTLEGTARGAWMLALWNHAPPALRLRPVDAMPLPGLLHYHQGWTQAVQAP